MWRVLLFSALIFAAGPALGGGNPESDLTSDWPEGYMPLREDCPKSYQAKWRASSTQNYVTGIGDVEFLPDGVSEWQKHGAISYRKLDGWVHDVLEIQRSFTGNNSGEGPYVVIAYPYLTYVGSGFVCQMSLSTCPTLEEVRKIEIGDGYLAKCQHYDYFVPRP